MKHTNQILGFLIMGLGIFLVSCSDFLDEKPSKSIVIPTTIEDLQSILNSIDQVNSGESLGLLLSDDLFMSDQGWLSLSTEIQEGYLWNKQISNSQGEIPSWSVAYGNIFRFNVVLDQAEKLVPRNEVEQAQLDQIVGTALFLRAVKYFELLELFTHPVISDADLNKEGLPLMLELDFPTTKERSTIGEVYDQVIGDLTQALDLLPSIGQDPLRPSKVAAYGYLARVYMQLGSHEQALFMANQALELKAELLDFNSIPALESIPIPLYTLYPIPRFNQEVVFHYLAGSQTYMFSDQTFVNQEVVDSYEENDIRKYLYFTAPDEQGRVNYLGSFSGDFWLFTGITTGELYLVKAEMLARLGRSEESLEALNTLLESRYYAGTFTPVELANEDSILEVVLRERRKELVYRGYLRWSDMRRFLRDENWQGVAPRVINGATYSLGLDPENYYVDIPLNEQERNGAL